MSKKIPHFKTLLLSILFVINVVLIILSFTIKDADKKVNDSMRVFLMVSGFVIGYLLFLKAVKALINKQNKVYIQGSTFDSVADVVLQARLKDLENNENVKLYKKMLQKHQNM